MNNERIIKFGDGYFRVGEEGGQLTLSPITNPEEIAAVVSESIILRDEDPDVSALQKTFEEAERELMGTLKTNIKATVLRMLGFSDSWNRGWEVDHCNGRMSQVTSLVKINVEALIGQLKPEDISLSVEEKEELRNLVKQEVKQRYKRELQHIAYSHISATVKADVNAALDALFAERKKEVTNKMLDSFLKPAKVK